MNLNLNDKKVLITGSSNGIGLAIAEVFLEEKAKTCLVSRGSKNLFKNEKRLQNKFGSKNIFASKCDCTCVNSLENLRKTINEKWKSLDIVVINVGNGQSVPDALPDSLQWKKIWNDNFDSALGTTRTFLPMLKKSKGCLLFISSITGIEAFGAPTDYSTAKSAVIALAKNLARKLASVNVRVNVIAPGNVLFKGGSWDKKIKINKTKVNAMIKSNVPMNRFATTQEIANSAVFLCSNRASFITGATLVIDGGQTVGVL